ncbi:MAG: dephospho-CoA kinase [Pseudomonadota bacterium]
MSAGQGEVMNRNVGLTGGIAAGKSVVSEILRGLGVAILDADELSRDVMVPGGSVLAQVVQAFGPHILDKAGCLDRRLVGELVFTNSKLRKKLESIVHPAIFAEADMRMKRLHAEGHEFVVYEAALLIETGRHEQMDILIVVVAEDSVRALRLSQRDGISLEKAQQRIKVQLPQTEKVQLADYVIDNSGTLEQTQASVQELWSKIKKR